EQVARGVELLRVACVKGVPSACSVYGGIVAQRELKGQFETALRALRSSCDSGYLDSCYNLAVTLEDGSLGSKRQHEAAQLAFEACEKEHLLSCTRLGYMFIKGHGLRKDPIRGAAIFYSACERGEASACEATGEALENGW